MNCLFRTFILYFFCSFGFLYSQYEFIYPIATIDDNNLLVMHQRSFDNLELWIWNEGSQVAFSALTSLCIPSCVRLLPSKTAFSFIDRGRIRIKYFNKRSSKAIDLYQPIHSVLSMRWITDESFYFVGNFFGYYAIFLCEMASDFDIVVTALMRLDNYHCLYPCKVNNHLFFVMKDSNQGYFIAQANWNPGALELPSPQPNLLISAPYPICHLTMESDILGFYMTCEKEENSHLYFAYYQLSKVGDGWEEKKLFDFKIPLQFLAGNNENRIYESMMPFLPFYASNRIFFSNHFSKSENGILLCYNLVEDKIEQISTSALNEVGVFAPIASQERILCGFYGPTESVSRMMRSNLRSGIFTCRLPQIITES